MKLVKLSPIFIFLLFLVFAPAAAQTYKTPNQGYEADLSKLIPIDRATLNSAFSEVKAYGIPFKYPQGGCESRAYIMNLILDSMKITNARIWIYAPAKFEAGDSAMLTIKDLDDTTQNISWGYHTAPVVLLKHDNDPLIDTMVLDPALNYKGALRYRDWMKKMGGYQQAEYSFILSKEFLFFTQNMNLINGNYYEYSGLCFNEMWLEKNLALDNVGRNLYWSYLRPGGHKYNPQLVAEIAPLIKNITVFENYILSNVIPPNLSLTEHQLYSDYPDFVTDCKDNFNRSVKRYYARLHSLSQYQQ